MSDLIIPTNETSCQRFFINQCVQQKLPVLFVGPTGTGKSAIALSYIMNLPKDKFLSNVINFSARTSASRTQEIIMSKLDRSVEILLNIYYNPSHQSEKKSEMWYFLPFLRRRKGVFGPAMGKQCLLFVDDLSMPQKEKYGAQPPIELLRQWLDHAHWYDPKDTSKLELVDIVRKPSLHILRKHNKSKRKFLSFIFSWLPALYGCHAACRGRRQYSFPTFLEAPSNIRHRVI